MEKDARLALIQEQILKFTLLDFSMQVPVSKKGDDLDAIIVGLNTLGEELRGVNINAKKQDRE